MSPKLAAKLGMDAARSPATPPAADMPRKLFAVLSIAERVAESISSASLHVSATSGTAAISSKHAINHRNRV
jgi:hypothetical protein